MFFKQDYFHTGKISQTRKSAHFLFHTRSFVVQVLPTVDALVGSSENLRKEVMKKEGTKDEKEVRPATNAATNASNVSSTDTTSTSLARPSVSSQFVF